MDSTGIEWIINACRGANLPVKLVGTLKCKRKLRFSCLVGYGLNEMATRSEEIVIHCCYFELMSVSSREIHRLGGPEF